MWPVTAPGSAGLTLAESVVDLGAERGVPDRVVSGVLRPTLTAMLPARPCGAAMLVAPGGSYVRLAVDREGVAIGEWLNRLGIAAFILKSRLPCDGHAGRRDVPLQDAQRALRLIRANAESWGVDPQRIGALGCSAGGHLVATLATGSQRPVYAPVDAVDAASARPDCIVLLYPVISMGPELAHAGSRRALLGDAIPPDVAMAYSTERSVGPDTPPAFIAHANDDGSVPPENSLRFYLALRAVGVSAELHIFDTGGHGFGISYGSASTRQWPVLCETWLRAHLLAL